jgi:hypothetical protein
MSFTQASTVSKPTTLLGFQSSNRVARLNCNVAMIRVSIPTKQELDLAQSHQTRQSMSTPDTATDTDLDRSVYCALKRM